MGWCRHPRTFSEVRVAEGLKADCTELLALGVYMHPRRDAHSLPSAWSDEEKSRVTDRSWKQFRPTQWRNKASRSQSVRR